MRAYPVGSEYSRLELSWSFLLLKAGGTEDIGSIIRLDARISQHL